jgi:hypothetical protein
MLEGMRRLQLRRGVVVVAVLVVGMAACQSRPAGNAGGADTGGWRRMDLPGLVQSAGGGHEEGGLSDVAVASPNDVWAVGFRLLRGEDRVPLALYWDGGRWRSFQPPAPSSASLVAVAASGPRDVWAVGEAAEPFVVHWSGAGWSQVPLAPVDAEDGLRRIWDLVAVSSTDAWLAGQVGIGAHRPVIQHWDGVRWSNVATPPVPTSMNGSTLRGLGAVSAGDVWAVGERDGSAETERGCLIEHWDGNRWSLVACPVPANTASAWLNAVTVLGPTDIWAVGGWTARQTGAEKVDTHALIEHWNGTEWQVMPAPDRTIAPSAVAARSGSDIVVAIPDEQVNFVHRDDSGWHPLALTPLVAAGQTPIIAALATAADGRIWAVGGATDAGQTTQAPIREASTQPLVLVRDP